MADASTISVLVRARDMASQAFQNIEANAGKMASGFEKHRKTIGVGMTAIGGVISGVGVLSLKAAADVEEMTNMFNVVFKDAAKEVEAWAKTTGDATGTSRFKLMEYAASLQDTFVPMGIARDKAADFSKEMVQLAVDLGSFKNEDPTDVLRRIQSGLVGNTEGMLNYGVVIKAADVNQRILTSGMAAHKDEITEAHRVQMRMKMMLEGTTDAQGDAARSLDSFTGRSRQMKKSLEEAQVTIGQALLPVMTSLLELVTPIITKISEWMQENEGLTKVLVIVGASLGAVMLVLGPMLLILPQLFAGFKLMAAGIRLVTAATAANPVGIILVALTTLAVVVLPLVMKNWDSIWNKILKITEKVVNFIIGILNKLTIIWRKQFELIAEVVAKLLDMGSKLPFVGDKFASAADAIRGFSDRLEEGIPQIDITSGRQEELQATVDNTAVAFSEADTDIAKANDGIVASTSEMATGTGTALGNASAEVAKHTAERLSHSEMIKQIQASQHKAEFDAEQTRLQQIKDDFAERVRISENLEASRDAANAALINGLSEVNQKWKDSGANVEEVMKLWSQTTGESFDEIGLKLDRFDTDLGDAESVVEAFTKGTGQNFFEMKEDIAFALEQANRTVEEKMADMGRVMAGTKFTDPMGRSLGLGEGGMKGFQAMSAGEQVEGIKSGMSTLSVANLSTLIGQGGAVASAAIDAIQQKWEGDEERIAAETALHEGGFGEHDTGVRLVARNSINDHLRLLAKRPQYAHLEQLSRDMTHTASWGQEMARNIASQLAPQKGGKQAELLRLYASGEISAFAQGGIVTRPTIGLVGEAGPEAIVPLGRGGKMGTVNNFHFHGAVYGVEDLKEAVVEAVRDHAISGGFAGVFAEA
jgi:hypothetical protein